MLSQLRPAIVLFALFTLLTGLAYPLAITALAQALFPRQANGSLVERDGRVIGSALIGQNFSSEKYFRGRPSATVAADPADAAKTVAAPYNAANSGGANLGPTSRVLLERIAGDAAQLKAENPGVAVPVDLVTASASGLDPQISPAAALFQAPRVARARGLAPERVTQLVAEHLEAGWLGLIGEPVVNVLELNLALDALGAQDAPKAGSH